MIEIKYPKEVLLEKDGIKINDGDQDIFISWETYAVISNRVILKTNKIIEE